MAIDIVPELYEQIQKDFQQNIEENQTIISVRKKLEKNTATSKEVALYAGALGKCAAKALDKNLTDNTLPNGTLYWNIAERTIIPLLKDAHAMVMATAESVQKREDKEIGITLNPVKPDFPSDRIHDLIDKLIEYQEQ